MSTYGYETVNESLDIRPSSVTGRTFIWVHEGKKEAAIIIDTEDVATVALELLKASASDWSTQPVDLVAIVASLERYVKAHDPKVKLQERRNALSFQLTGEGECGPQIPYAARTAPLRQAIDRIIELEDGASHD